MSRSTSRTLGKPKDKCMNRCPGRVNFVWCVCGCGHTHTPWDEDITQSYSVRSNPVHVIQINRVLCHKKLWIYSQYRFLFALFCCCSISNNSCHRGFWYIRGPLRNLCIVTSNWDSNCTSIGSTIISYQLPSKQLIHNMFWSIVFFLNIIQMCCLLFLNLLYDPSSDAVLFTLNWMTSPVFV